MSTVIGISRETASRGDSVHATSPDSRSSGAAGPLAGSAIAIASRHRQFRRSTARRCTGRLQRRPRTALGSADAQSAVGRSFHHRSSGTLTTRSPPNGAVHSHGAVLHRRDVPDWSRSAMVADHGRAVLLGASPASSGSRSLRVAPFLWIQARDRLVSGAATCWSSRCRRSPSPTRAARRSTRARHSAGWPSRCGFPYAFAAGTLHGKPIDAHSARASLRRDGLPVQAIFEVDRTGRIVRAPRRALSRSRRRTIGPDAMVRAATPTTRSLAAFACLRQWRSRGTCQTDRSAMRASGLPRSNTTSPNRFEVLGAGPTPSSRRSRARHHHSPRAALLRPHRPRPGRSAARSRTADRRRAPGTAAWTQRGPMEFGADHLAGHLDRRLGAARRISWRAPSWC